MEDINDEDEGTKLKKRRRNVNEVPITRLRTMPITRLSGRITLQYEIMGLKMCVDFSSLWMDGDTYGRTLCLGLHHCSQDSDFSCFNPAAEGRKNIVKLRKREGQRVDLGRSLKGHLKMVDVGWWISFP